MSERTYGEDACVNNVHSFSTKDAEVCECGAMNADGTYRQCCVLPPTARQVAAMSDLVERLKNLSAVLADSGEPSMKKDVDDAIAALAPPQDDEVARVLCYTSQEELSGTYLKVTHDLIERLFRDLQWHRTDLPEMLAAEHEDEIDRQAARVKTLEEYIEQQDDALVGWRNKSSMYEGRIEELEQAQRWISVEESVPWTQDVMLLYFPTEAVRLGYYYQDAKIFGPPHRGIDTQWKFQPTHWKPITTPDEQVEVRTVNTEDEK